MSDVIVLNADYGYLHSISWQEAICLLFKDVAVTIIESGKKARSAYLTMTIPEVIVLKKQVRTKFKKEVPWSRHAMFLRDGFACQYCGTEQAQRHLTVDHVIPRAQGGKTSFDNCVTACYECNQIKGDKTPRQSQMRLAREPYHPTIGEYIKAKLERKGVLDKLESHGL